MTAQVPARVARVAGPLVEVENLDEVSMLDLVEVGHSPGEVVGLSRDRVSLQMYEYTGGMSVGDRAQGLGRPLSIPLGPGLLGGIFDGLLRPLPQAPAFLKPGWGNPGFGENRSWSFEPDVRDGDRVTPGMTLGTVEETKAIAHRILVPPGVEGIVTQLSAGEHEADEQVMRIDDTRMSLTSWWPVRQPRPIVERLPSTTPLRTGQRVVDLLFPIAEGSTAAVPGGFGTGKTMLLQQIAKWCSADVIVYVGCGERGNEMAEVLEDLPHLEDPRTGRSLMERTVIVANTSNMPVMAREVSIYTGITIGEYYRDMGYSAVVIADSTSRWAEALREFASRKGELPTEEGHPAELASALAAFYERAGRVRTLGETIGSTTIISAVSPPGGDMTEPVTAHTQRFVRVLWSLDPDLAAARHYPAVSWHQSFSRDAETLAGWHVVHGDTSWASRRARAMATLAQADELEPVVQLVGRKALPDRERVVLLAARLIREGVLQQNALSSNDAYAGPAKLSALLTMMLDIFDTCQSLVHRGVPASLIEEVDLSDAVRIRDRTGPDETGPIEEVRAEMLRRLEDLA
jgi:V/A-type H+-transporting ATPase subunit A